MERSQSTSLERERGEDRSIRLMADEAETLAPRFARLETAAYQVLTNNRVQGTERAALFGRIMAELRKRESARKRADHRRREEIAPAPPSKQPGLYGDAHAHQMRQPRDTWDPDAEEDARQEMVS